MTKEKYINPFTDFGFEEASLKYYRDLKNVIDTAVAEGESNGRIEGRMEGKIEGIIEGKMEGKIEGISKSLRRGKLTIEEIAEDFEVTIEFVLQIKSQQGL